MKRLKKILETIAITILMAISLAIGMLGLQLTRNECAIDARRAIHAVSYEDLVIDPAKVGIWGAE